MLTKAALKIYNTVSRISTSVAKLQQRELLKLCDKEYERKYKYRTM